MHYRWAVILAIFLAPATIHALSLTEALEAARQEAVTLQTLAAETRQAEAVHQQSSQAYLPSVSADASWLRADSSLITGVPVPSLGIPPTIQRADLGPVEGTLTGVQVIQPLINADAIKLRQAAALKLDARRHAQQWGNQAIRLEISRLYFNVLRQRERVEAVQMSYQAARKAATLAHASYREGLASRLDTEQADAELAAIEARIEHVNAQRVQAQVELETLLGMTPEQEIVLSTPLPRPSPPVRIGDPRARKDLQARQLAAEAASAGTSASRAEWMPRVNLLARQQWVEGNEPLNESSDGWLVAVNIQWTIFDGLGRQGRIAESRAEEEKARIELEGVKRRIQREQTMAMTLWQAGYAGWHAAQKATEAATRAEQLALRRYEEGIGSMTDLLAAQARLDRQRTNLVDARYQAVLAAMNYHLQNGYDPILAVREQLP
ncbi:TolC family protein [Marinobacter orientalis]|uniref:TolC family protein n=1 Tax=Marinobacter orientalis TaxID=1928859 RepID=A0A7Y0NLI1_9GAMM|nr:TolC family protein [Marinobacter orientalis]NMT62991.1 TolC family protein [Marinobacter orientalis]TGX51656.1 TolC family protein [Marinobacter orientalis]